MGTIITRALLTDAAVLLQDTENTRWPLTELLKWFNHGQRDAVANKPNASSRNTIMQLVAGTRQTIPTDGVQLLDILRNMGPNRATPGRSIRLTQREILDAQLPEWHFSTPAATAVHYMYSRLDPHTFYVYPPQPTTNPGSVEMVYSAAPLDAVLDGPITLDDIYAPALLDYVLYRAYGKDADYTGDAARATAHFQAYAFSITGKAKSEDATNPNMNAPANPNVTPTR
jgi:hypothetical protein